VRPAGVLLAKGRNQRCRIVVNGLSSRARRGVLLLCAVVLGLTVAGCGQSMSSTSTPEISPLRVGFSGGGEFLWESDAALRRDYDYLEYSGAKWVRLDVDWDSVEPTKGSFYWTYTDRVVYVARAHGLNVLLVPTYTPPWARRSVCATSMYCPPADPGTYGDFVYRTVSRYAPIGIHHYEMWNEPNWDPWWASGPNAADYARLLRPAYLEAHAADRNVTVLTGGLAPHGDLGAHPDDPRSPINFLKALYAAGAHGYFDAFANHPYPPLPHDPLSGTIGWNALLQTEWEHDIMTSNGDGAKKIWGTEYGAPTGSSDPKAVTPDQQAWYIEEGLRWWTSHTYTGPLFIHTVRDAPMTSPDDWHHCSGVLWQDYTPKPAFGRLAGLLH
jgi:hypothetical protein